MVSDCRSRDSKSRQMTVEIFCLAEAASIKNGQVCVLHTFANYLAPKIPQEIGGCLIAQLRFMHDEEGDHVLQCEMVDADGVVRWESQKAVTTIQRVSGCQGWPQIFILHTEAYIGQHEIRLKLDGEIVATCLLAVIAVRPDQVTRPPSIV